MELEREDILKIFLEWRNIETPCEKCGGSGVTTYNNTSTYMHSIGGCTITTDICDRCWGTGDKNKKGINLRTYSHLFLNGGK